MDVFGGRGNAPLPLRLAWVSAPVSPPHRSVLLYVVVLALLVDVAALVEPCWHLSSECPPLLEAALTTDTDYS